MADSTPHIITAEEVKEVRNLGFSITGNTKPVEKFINERFPGFDLLTFAKKTDDILKPLTSEEISRTIEVSESEPPWIRVEYLSEDYLSETGLAFSRIFRRQEGELVVDHGYFQLPEKERNKGKAKELFREHIPLYKKTGVKKIYVNASMEDGGLVWAKNYFVATDKSEVDAILAKAFQSLPHEQARIIHLYYDNYYQKNPEGTAFPIVNWSVYPFMEEILRGSNWKGLMDLENQEQFSNFIRYING